MESPSRPQRAISRQFTLRSSRHPRDSMEDELRPASPTNSARNEERIESPPEQEHKLSRSRCIILVVLLLTCLLFSLLDTTIVSTSLLETAKDLGNVEDISWIVLAYLLTYMGFSIIFAKLSDIFGRLYMLQVSWLLFALASFFCGHASSMTELIVARAFQGVGAAGLYSLPFICIHEHVPTSKWHLVGASVACTLSVSYVLGPVLGGAIPHLSSWRVLYLINIPVAGTVSMGLYIVYPRPRQQIRTSPLSKLRKIDFPGALLLLAASMMMIYSIQEAGSMKSAWNSPAIVTVLVLSLVCWVAFWCWEAFLGFRGGIVSPIFPLSLSGKRPYLACLLSTFFLGFVFMTTVVTLPERSQIVDNRNVLIAGVELLPLLAAVAVGTFASVPFTKPKNRTTLSLMIGTGLMSIGTGLMTTLENMAPMQATAAIYGFKVILGLGFGFCLSSTTVMANVLGRGDDMAVANGAMAQARVLGSAIGLGIWTVIFNAKAGSSLALRDQESGGLLTAFESSMLHRSPSSALLLKGPARNEVRVIYMKSFTDMMIILAIVSASTFVTSVCTLQSRPPPVDLAPRLPSSQDGGAKEIPRGGSSSSSNGSVSEGRSSLANSNATREGGTLTAAERLDNDIELGRMPTEPHAVLPK